MNEGLHYSQYMNRRSREYLRPTLDLASSIRARRSSRQPRAPDFVNLTNNARRRRRHETRLANLPVDLRKKIIERLNNVTNVAALSETSTMFRNQTKTWLKEQKIADGIVRVIKDAHRLSTASYIALDRYNFTSHITSGATRFLRKNNYFEAPSGVTHKTADADVFIDNTPHTVRVTYPYLGGQIDRFNHPQYKQHIITLRAKRNRNRLWVGYRYDYVDIGQSHRVDVWKFGTIDPASSATWAAAARVAFRRLGVQEV